MLIKNIETIIANEQDNLSALYQVALLISKSFKNYDWVGFYFAVPSEKNLVLGPFVGEKTEHIRIPYGSGICGRVAEELATLVISDVSRESNYLSCSIKVKSEIVVPIFSENGIFLGELDIDSHEKDNFKSHDIALLEEIAGSIKSIMPRY